MPLPPAASSRHRQRDRCPRPRSPPHYRPLLDATVLAARCCSWCCCWIPMFRSRRRAALARRLNRARVAHEEAAASEADAVLSLLSERQLELFLQAVESGGGRDCVLVPRESNLLLHCLRLWRWQDLEGDEKLRRLPFCKAAIDPRYECCHPFHWSRIYYVGEYRLSHS